MFTATVGIPLLSCYSHIGRGHSVFSQHPSTLSTVKERSQTEDRGLTALASRSLNMGSSSSWSNKVASCFSAIKEENQTYLLWTNPTSPSRDLSDTSHSVLTWRFFSCTHHWRPFMYLCFSINMNLTGHLDFTLYLSTIRTCKMYIGRVIRCFKSSS